MWGVLPRLRRAAPPRRSCRALPSCARRPHGECIHHALPKVHDGMSTAESASMLGLWWVIWRRASCGVVWLVVAGCWSSQPLVDNTFTDDEWKQLQKFTLPPPDVCPMEPRLAVDCEAAARLGKKLFFDPTLAGPIAITDPAAPDKVSCASCHDTTKYLSDTRSLPSPVSIGTGYTKHNALGLINSALKAQVAYDQCG